MLYEHIYGFPYIFLRYYANKCNIGLNEIKQPMKIINLMLNKLLDFIKCFIYEKEQLSSINNISIEIVNLNSVNAFINNNKIFIDIRLIKLIGDISILISHFIYTQKYEDYDEFIAALLSRIRQSNNLYFEYEEPFYTVFEAASEENMCVTEKANVISMAIVIFVICHEIAHFMLNNEEDNNDIKSLKASILDNHQAKEYVYKFENENLNTLLKEFGADIKGVQLYLDLLLTCKDIINLGLNRFTVGWAPLYFFNILDTIDAVNYKLYNKPIKYLSYADPLERKNLVESLYIEAFNQIYLINVCRKEYCKYMDVLEDVKKIVNSGDITGEMLDEHISIRKQHNKKNL